MYAIEECGFMSLDLCVYSPFDSEQESAENTSEVHPFMYAPMATDRECEGETDFSEENSLRLPNLD